MKARALKKFLGTERTVHETDTHICVASAMCSELISVDKKTLTLSYALDTFNKGRNALLSDKKSDLLAIWDKLDALIQSKEILDYIEGEDEIENPLPVFYEKDEEILEAITDEYGYPNVTSTGRLMHANTYFPTREKAISHYLESAKLHTKFLKRDIAQTEKELEKDREKLKKIEAAIEKYS